MTLLLTITYVSYLWNPVLGAYAFGLPRLLDVQRHLDMQAYRLLLWSAASVSFLGLLRMPDQDPEVRKNFFRFQFGASLYASFAIETGIMRANAPFDVFEGGPAQLLFLVLTFADFALALFWMFTIVAVSEKDSDVVAGVATDAPTSVLAVVVGPCLGACGLLVPPLFALLAGSEANTVFLASQPSFEAATLNTNVSLILAGNIAAFCLTATRRRWLTNGQALATVLLTFFATFYDVIAYASDSERIASFNTLNSAAYSLHLPEVLAAIIALVLATASSREH